MAAYLAFVYAHAVWFGALIVSALMGARLERMIPRSKGRPRARRWARTGPFVPAPPPFDAAEQLRCVERARFSARPVMNRGEARLFEILERACAAEAPGWRVMAQVSLGEILASPDADAFRAINSKRVDLLLVGPDAMPLHAIELQGSGHHLGPAATRDAIKKEALRKAGVGYLEVLPGDTPSHVRGLVARLVAPAQRRRASA